MLCCVWCVLVARFVQTTLPPKTKRQGLTGQPGPLVCHPPKDQTTPQRIPSCEVKPSRIGRVPSLKLWHFFTLAGSGALPTPILAEQKPKLASNPADSTTLAPPRHHPQMLPTSILRATQSKNHSLPEFMNFKLFGMAILVGNVKFGYFFWAIHSASETKPHEIWRNIALKVITVKFA